MRCCWHWTQRSRSSRNCTTEKKPCPCASPIAVTSTQPENRALPCPRGLFLQRLKALKRSHQLDLERVAKRRLAQLGERREREMILMAVDEHFDPALHAAGFLDVFGELLAKVGARIA